MSSILASLDMSLDDLIARKKPKASNPSSRPAKQHKDKDTVGPIRGGRRRNASRKPQPYARSLMDNKLLDLSAIAGRSDGVCPLRLEERRGRGGNEDDMDIDLDDVADNGNGSRSSKKRSVVIKKVGNGGKKGGGVSILSRLGSKDSTSSGTKILVKNLKFDILEEEVRELFGTVGEVSKAEIVYDRSGRSKGIARVWFTRRSDADKAIKQYDGRTLDGLPMQITLDSDKNVRNGLFGTALKRDDKDVKFKVSFGGNKDNEQSNGRRNSRRGRVNEKGSHGNRESAPSKTTEDLDNEMDTYMNDA
uniref:RRM domain-containing protein n=1 Tax=Hyaloperonospora arabidopsidis (strain Emoy2) TaxID=559515 RepID=M4BX91_HYAAE